MFTIYYKVKHRKEENESGERGGEPSLTPREKRYNLERLSINMKLRFELDITTKWGVLKVSLNSQKIIEPNVLHVEQLRNNV